MTPNDLFTWLPDNKGQDHPDHPLQRLRANAALPRLLQDLQKMTPDKLRMMEEFAKKVLELK